MAQAAFQLVGIGARGRSQRECEGVPQVVWAERRDLPLWIRDFGIMPAPDAHQNEIECAGREAPIR